MDWKLFARALQFVTRASNECQMAAGDKEIYRSTGDVTKLGQSPQNDTCHSERSEDSERRENNA